MTTAYDRREHAYAARIEQKHPGWVVLWGMFSRRYWAFPTNTAIPRGTILSAPQPRELVAAIRQAELAAAPGGLAQLLQHPPPDQPREGGPSHA
jgi:hypothetical protein